MAQNTIPDSKRESLSIIFKKLDLTQKDVAELLDISPTAVSRFLAIGPDRINLRSDYQRQIVKILDDRLADCRTIKTSTPEQVAEWRAKENDLVDVALALSSGDIQTLQRQIKELLSDDGAVGEGPRPAFLATPGGALPVHAANYVARQADAEIEAILVEGRAPASIVIAPINGGTSSFLNRVYQRAQGLRDCWACMVHLDAAFVPGEPFTQLDLFKHLFREIGVPNETLSGRHLDVHDMKEVFDDWAKSTWKDPSRVVLVIDGLDQVFANAGSVVDALAVTNWLQVLRNAAGRGEAPYDKLALFVPLTGQTWSAAHASPWATQAAPLELRKFTLLQVGQVFEKLAVSIDQSGVEEVHRLFYGHPYLTQLFAWEMRRGATQEEARTAAMNIEGGFEAHWERMKSQISFLIGSNYSVKKVIAAVLDETGHPQAQPVGEGEETIWQTYRRGLRMFGLVDGSGKAPDLCEFYRVAIARELS